MDRKGSPIENPFGKPSRALEISRSVEELSHRLAAAQTNSELQRDPRRRPRVQDVEMQRAHSTSDQQHAHMERAFSGLKLEGASSPRKPGSPPHEQAPPPPAPLSLANRRKSVRHDLAALGEGPSPELGDVGTPSPPKRPGDAGPPRKKRSGREPAQQEREQTSSISLGSCRSKPKRKRKRRKGSPSKEAQMTTGGSSAEGGSEYESPLMGSPTERSISRHSGDSFSFSQSQPPSG